MTVQQFVAKYNVFLKEIDGIVKVGTLKKIKKAEQNLFVDFVRENRTEIIAVIEAEKEAAKTREIEREEREAATVYFYSTGWESHKIGIDTRKDIEEQLRFEAHRYRDDCTYESLRANFLKAVEEIAAKAEAKNAKEAEIEAIKQKAAESGEKQEISSDLSYKDTGEETIWITTTTWAMPDGTITKTREESL